MARCTRCGGELPLDAMFCPQCALPVPAPSPASSAAGGAGSGVMTVSDLQTIAGATPNKATELTEGQVFHDRYVIERYLGAGAMGVVYVAKDRTSGEPVAIKLINPALADRPDARGRFVREGVTSRNVRHPNVVAMFDVGEADGQVYLVMEYVRGETLRKWLRRTLQEGRDVAFETARGIIRAVLEGLAAAHATGVVHRDLKPENIMLLGDPQARDYRLKILDFGIARAVGTTSHQTTSSSSTGTPLYMAPEQKTAADTVGPPADLYAVTAMLYEILIGVAPEGRWGAPSRERKDLPPGVDPMVEKGLASRPRSRYQSAEEYIAALDGIGGRPLEAAEPPAPLLPAESAQPHERPTASIWAGLVTRSRVQSPASWALWDRLSTPQRIVFAIAAVAAAGGLFGYCQRQRHVGVSGGPAVSRPTPETPPSGHGAAQPPRTEEGTEKSGSGTGTTRERTRRETPPPPPAHMIIAGRWSDEVAGAGFAIGYVDVNQQGQDVGGPICNMQGYQVGTFQGRVEGTSLAYNYVAANGVTGTGRGVLRDDGVHLDVQVQEHLTGRWERHTLHKNHWPPG